MRRWAGPVAVAALLVWLHRYLLHGQVAAVRDLFRLSIPQSQVLRDRLLAGELPLWVAGTRLGQPFLAVLDSQVLYPPRVLLVLVFGAVFGVNLMLPLHAALASAGAYRAARALGATRTAAWIACALGLTPFFARLEPMLAASCSLAWSGWILAASVRLARRPTRRHLAIFALTFALSALAGAPETVCWQAAVALAGVAVAVRRRRNARPWLGAAAGLALGAALVAQTYLPAAELWREWKPPPGVWAQTQTLLWSASVPQLVSMGALYADRPASDDPDENQFLTSSLFIGALGCALAFFAGRRRWPLALVAAACALAALGNHLPPAAWLLKLGPGAMFRYPVKFAFASAFVVAVLAALGAQRFVARVRRRRWPASHWAIALGAVLALGFVAAQVLKHLEVRAGLTSGALWATLMLLVAGLIAFVLRRRPRALGPALAVAVAVELVIAHVVIGPLETFDPNELRQPSELAAQLRELHPQRLSIDMEGELDPVTFVRRSRENLVPLRHLEEHFDAVEGYGFRNPWRLVRALDEPTLGLYQALGVSHFVRSGAQPFAGVSELLGNRDVQLYETQPMPRAWVVQDARALDEQAAIALLRSGPDAVSKTVALNRDVFGEPCESKVTELSRSDERLALDVDACANGFLVMSDAYFPGWRAEVDDAPEPIERADDLFRAVAVHSGHHRVRLGYQPKSFQLGLGISAGAAIMWAWLLFSRKRPKTL